MAKARQTKIPELRSPREWVEVWLDIQPPDRFRGSKESVDHPNALMCPSSTEPCAWALFWLRARETVFGIVLGLKSCYPLSRETETRMKTGGMATEIWSAWLDDVLWVFYHLIGQYVS